MAKPDDNFDLQRFVTAQEAVYEQVCAELRSGRKQSHWMWFIFPQLRGLGRSETAEFYGISSREEAVAYLAHPVLGVRLRECTGLVNHVEGRSVDQIFGSPDDLKFHSSMTLFSLVRPEESLFRAALEKFFGGKMDGRTVELL